ncbi:hypothetical protein LY76DRAFT_189030 [Colletotrichum caudatum]|nr:hypothetical protein LY76DRAFT_189030 [Colletotrichum caudatum]
MCISFFHGRCKCGRDLRRKRKRRQLTSLQPKLAGRCAAPWPSLYPPLHYCVSLSGRLWLAQAASASKQATTMTVMKEIIEEEEEGVKKRKKKESPDWTFGSPSLPALLQPRCRPGTLASAHIESVCFLQTNTRLHISTTVWTSSRRRSPLGWNSLVEQGRQTRCRFSSHCLLLNSKGAKQESFDRGGLRVYVD